MRVSNFFGKKRDKKKKKEKKKRKDFEKKNSSPPSYSFNSNSNSIATIVAAVIIVLSNYRIICTVALSSHLESFDKQNNETEQAYNSVGLRFELSLNSIRRWNRLIR